MSTAFNISKGKIQWYWEQVRDNVGSAGTGAGLIVSLWKTTGLEADGILADYDNIADLITPNVQADFTNYAAKIVQGPTATVVIDDTGNRALLDLPDQTWVDAGGAANNTLGKVIISYDPNLATGDNTTLIPLLAHDITATTDGNDLIVRFHADGASRIL